MKTEILSSSDPQVMTKISKKKIRELPESSSPGNYPKERNTYFSRHERTIFLDAEIIQPPTSPSNTYREPTVFAATENDTEQVPYSPGREKPLSPNNPFRP